MAQTKPLKNQFIHLFLRIAEKFTKTMVQWLILNAETLHSIPIAILRAHKWGGGWKRAGNCCRKTWSPDLDPPPMAFFPSKQFAPLTKVIAEVSLILINLLKHH